jgi:hypothetical protein
MNAGMSPARAGRHRRDLRGDPGPAIHPAPVRGGSPEHARGRLVTFAARGLLVVIPSRVLRRWGQDRRAPVTGDWRAEESGYRQPFSIGPGDAAEIAEFLRQRGYSGCSAGQVTAELARPERERSMIGHVAAEMLRSARWRL